MEIKFTTNYNCLGDFDECILFEGIVKTEIGAKRAKNKAISAFERFGRMSPNYPFITSVKLNSGDWHDLRICDPDIEDFINSPELLDDGGIDKYIRDMDSFMGN